MKIREIILDTLIGTRLFEMAFQRKRVIEQLTNLQDQINLHALKIIAWSGAQEVPHWKRELTTWGNDLAGMWLRGRPSRPMGFDLAWKHLYLEPFEGAEDFALTFRLQRIQQEYQRPITKQPAEIVAEYMTFIRQFCEVIGRGQLTGDIVNALGGRPTPAVPVPESVPV
jgi:hypothetical protein